MYMNEYFLSFHRHSMAPMKIIKQETKGKDLDAEQVAMVK